MNLKTIIFTGRSGCGKGTQVEKLMEVLKEKDSRQIYHLESGEKFRNFIKEKNYASRLSAKIYDEGALQPEFLSTWVWASLLIENLKGDMHVILDGTPRRLDEARVLESAFAFFERSKVEIVYLNVGREWAIERMKARGRVDDKKMDEILSRLNWFDSDVVPALDYYRGHRQHVFHEINGEQEVEKVHEDIIKALDL